MGKGGRGAFFYTKLIGAEIVQHAPTIHNLCGDHNDMVRE
jgi:hypothetical protein